MTLIFDVPIFDGYLLRSMVPHSEDVCYCIHGKDICAPIFDRSGLVALLKGRRNFKGQIQRQTPDPKGR